MVERRVGRRRAAARFRGLARDSSTPSEVWTYERGAIRVQVLRDGVYVDSAVSEVLPGIDLPRLAAFLDRPSTSAARREYLATLRR